MYDKFIGTTEILKLDRNYNLLNGTPSVWNYAGNLPNARASFKLVSINNVVYLLGKHANQCSFSS